MTNEPVQRDDEQAGEPSFSPDGVDLTLIRWMLSLTPAQRLEVAQDASYSIRMKNPGLPLEDRPLQREDFVSVASAVQLGCPQPSGSSR